MKKSIMALATSVLLAGTALVQADDRPELRIAVQQNPASQEPADQASNVAYRNNFSIHETLLTFDMRGDYSVQPNVAESWEWEGPTALVVKLKPGLIFHDGTEMDAEDVAFSFGPERLSTEDAPGYATYLANFTSLDRVEVIDPLTVRFVTKYEDPILLQRLASYPAVVISKAAFLATDWTEWRQKPIGLGPYKVESYVVNENVVLSAHDQAMDGAPNVSRVSFRIVPEIASRAAGLLAGDFDIVTDLPPDQLASIENAEGFTVRGGPVANIRILFLDKNNPVLSDVRLRQALSLAVDRNAIVEAIWSGRSIVPPGLQFPTYGEVFNPDYQPVPYDPARAAALLAESGYNGEEITVRSMNNYYTAENPVTEAVVAMWQAMGVNARMEYVQGTAGFTTVEGRAAGNWSYTSSVPDPITSFYGQFGQGGLLTSLNIWSNEEFDALGEELSATMDPLERREIFTEMMNIIEWEDVGVIPLHANAVFYGVRDGIEWEPLGDFFLDLGADSLSFTGGN